MRSISYLLLTVALSVPGVALAKGSVREPLRLLMAYKDRVAAATVTLPERSCAGSIAGNRFQAVTAAHCVNEGATRVLVKLPNGDQRYAEVGYIDREQDLAVLRFSKEVPIEPLALSDHLPAPGTEVLFVGRTDRPSRPQVAKVEKLGTCPSLPEVSDALFTTLQARPGDSGAPLVDESMRVVGVVHGGAQCHIAAPTAPLAVLSFDRPGNHTIVTRKGPTEHAAPEPEEPALYEKRMGPLVWERTPNGFRFRINLSFEWKSDDTE